VCVINDTTDDVFTRTLEGPMIDYSPHAPYAVIPQTIHLGNISSAANIPSSIEGLKLAASNN